MQNTLIRLADHFAGTLAAWDTKTNTVRAKTDKFASSRDKCKIGHEANCYPSLKQRAKKNFSLDNRKTNPAQNMRKRGTTRVYASPSVVGASFASGEGDCPSPLPGTLAGGDKGRHRQGEVSFVRQLRGQTICAAWAVGASRERHGPLPVPL